MLFRGTWEDNKMTSEKHFLFFDKEFWETYVGIGIRNIAAEKIYVVDSGIHKYVMNEVSAELVVKR